MVQGIESGTLGNALSRRAENILRTQQSGDPQARKAAQDFEAILLAQFLEKLQETMTSLGSDEASDPAHDSFQQMGFESIASALARAGGIGVADLILKHLSPVKLSSPTADEPTGKRTVVLPETAEAPD
jgi:Rod binding domain-containing protein